VTPKDRRLILAALDEAAQRRTDRAASDCADCSAAPDEMCAAHAEDLDQADAYRSLADRLGGVDR
jgi:hypothetical protein